MNNISIRNLTILVGALATAILFILFLLSNSNNHKQHVYQGIIQIMEETDIDMLLMRRMEKDFIMRLDAKYVERHKEMRPVVEKHLHETDELTKEVEQSWGKDEIVSSFELYYQHFDHLVEQEYKIGLDEKSGLRGSLRKSIHEVEKISNAEKDVTLLAHTLMLRRHEKDFLLRNQTKYLDRHDKQLEVTREYLESRRNTGSKQALLDGLEDYQTKFKALAQAKQELGLDSDQGIQGEMRRAVHHLEEILEGELYRLKKLAKKEDAALGELTNMFFVVGSLLIIGILIVMVWQIATRSGAALGFVDRLYQNIQAKDFAALRDMNVEGKDEFARISRRMAELGEQISVMYSEMESAAAASERIKQALDVAKAPVFVADDDLNIIYQNNSMDELLKSRSTQLASLDSELQSANLLERNAESLYSLLGSNISLKNLKHQQDYELEFSGVVIHVSAAAIISDEGQRLGLVFEWNDMTERLAKEHEERRIANENAGIRLALDCCDTNVMIADSEYNITYMNQAVDRMMRDAEADLQSSISGFDANNLLGQNIDVFHKNPSHQRQMLAELSDVYRGRITSGGRTFDLIATPMFNSDKERLGTVVEWDDITQRLAQEEEDKRQANENASIRLALDVCDTNVMMADTNYNITYMNHAVQNMMQDAEADLKKVLPNFDAKNLKGQNIDVFHKNPAHQRGMLGKLTDVYRTEIVVGGRTFALIATPIFSEAKERLGTVVEWNDRTSEVSIEKEIDGLIVAANDGNLTTRMDLTGKSGFFRSLSEGLNHLMSGLEVFASDMSTVFDALAQGDLSQTISREYKGQFEVIKNDANEGLSKLAGSLSNIQRAAMTVGTSSSEVSQGADDLSRRTESQASSLEETASSMEEINATVRQTAENAGQSAQLANEAKRRAEDGGEVVSGAVAAMAEILRSSNQINDIIGVIDEIAFQTNLLALNAAVEAARAGEHGRGFAVVAGEVRTLSQRSAGAAKEIKDLIRDSVNKVESGSSLVNESGAVLESIVDAVDKVATMIEAVNNAAKEQTNGISQINQAISSMDDMTQQNAALVEQSSAASRSMSEEVRNMNTMINAFKLS